MQSLHKSLYQTFNHFVFFGGAQTLVLHDSLVGALLAFKLTLPEPVTYQVLLYYFHGSWQIAWYITMYYLVFHFNTLLPDDG